MILNITGANLWIDLALKFRFNVVGKIATIMKNYTMILLNS